MGGFRQCLSFPIVDTFAQFISLLARRFRAFESAFEFLPLPIKARKTAVSGHQFSPLFVLGVALERGETHANGEKVVLNPVLSLAVVLENVTY
ncbi:MAG: hypothetical protein FJ304_22145 [Planctomycetes bacterium]|nr:hypothetical protein [Planctomycetota bacterium]